MAAPVWTLSVDLQTKTATFQSGMSAAAQSARGAFTEIKAGAQEMGAETGHSMTEARHGVMLLGEEFGVHLPRGVTSFLASLGPIAGAMSAAFPFIAIAVGATLLLEHLSKLREEGAKLTLSQTNFGTAVANVFNALDTKLLEAGIRADELNHNHLGALEKQLSLIDHQSLTELTRSFEEVAKAADVTFAQLKTSWYQFGSGSTGAKAALEHFKSEYDSLLAQGKDKEGHDLLAGTLQSAERVLALQQQVKDNLVYTDKGGKQHGDYGKAEQATIELKKIGVGYTEKEVEAQKTLVEALEAQVGVEQKVADLKKLQDSNATQTTQKAENADSDKAARDQARSEAQAVEDAEKLREQSYREAVANLEENEREKIDATKQGSAARLTVIDAAIKQEEAYGLQDTGFYRSLLQSRVQTAREMSLEQAKMTAEAGKEAAEHELKMGELQVQSDREAAQLRMSQKRVTDNERMQSDLQLAEKEYAIQKTALDKEIAALNQSDADYLNKLKQLQDKELQLTRAHENQITQIQNKAVEERNARILAAYRSFDDSVARSMTQAIMGHKGFASSMESLGNQVASGLIQNALKSIMADDMTKERDAAAAARKAFLAGMAMPAPANMVIAPAWAAMAFAATMAFAEGGIVPGVSLGDSVPAMLTPGEAVLPKGLTEGAYERREARESRR